MGRYLVVLKGTYSEWKKNSPAEIASIMQRYGEWVSSLRNQDKFETGDALEGGGVSLRRRNGEVVVDGPFPETKEVLTGYFVLKAESIEEATKISRSCPALSHGDSVEVFKIQEM